MGQKSKPTTRIATDRAFSRISTLNKRPERVEVLQIRPRIVVRSLQDERGMRVFRMARDAAQGFTANVAFADGPVPIDTRVIRRPRMFEMHGADSLLSDRARKLGHGRL